MLRPGGIDRAIHRREYGARMVEEDAAGRQERHAARRSREELRPDLVLERADVPADRRLSHVEPLRRTAHVAFLGHGDEVA